MTISLKAQVKCTCCLCFVKAAESRRHWSRSYTTLYFDRFKCSHPKGDQCLRVSHNTPKLCPLAIGGSVPRIKVIERSGKLPVMRNDLDLSELDSFEITIQGRKVGGDNG